MPTKFDSLKAEGLTATLTLDNYGHAIDETLKRVTTMGAADITAWRRQNSDPVRIEVFLADGTRRVGTYLKSRDKQLKDLFNATHEMFLEIDCQDFGPTLIAKAAVVEIREFKDLMARENEEVAGFEKRAGQIDKVDAWSVLGLEPGADKELIHVAYLKQARAYHPDRFLQTELPEEIRAYIDAMSRRINAAYTELRQHYARSEKNAQQREQKNA